jgi:presenilin-like A22 family membrane protease
MDQRTRAAVAAVALVVVFLVVQVGALALVEPFKQAGYQPVDDPDDPTNSLVYVGAILVITALLLGAIRLGFDRFLRGFIVLAGAYISLYVFRIVLPPASLPAPAGFHLLAWAAAAVLGVALWVYPEWYVIDAAGVVMGIGAAGLFGITFGILPALLLLAVLAVYDAISVYGTEHMLALASGVMELRVPIVLVVPLTRSYSFLDADLPDPTAEETDGPAHGDPPGDGELAAGASEADETPAVRDEGPLERDALFIGLGDAIVPAVLVASAGYFLEDVPAVAVGGLTLSLPVVGAMVGTVLGLLVLLRMVFAGRAHAGLPLLNGGAIGGYLVGALASGLTLTQALGLESLV